MNALKMQHTIRKALLPVAYWISCWIVGLVDCQCFIDTRNQSKLYIGVIQSRVPVIDEDSEIMAGCNVTIKRFITDFSEPFNVFRKLRLLDMDNRTDLIILENNIKLTTVDTSMFSAARKPLIWWGRTPLYTQSEVENSGSGHKTPEQNNTTMEDKPIPISDERPYCLNALQGEIKNETFVDIVPFTGAHVVNSLVTKYLHWQYVFIFYENSTAREETLLEDGLSSGRVLNAAFNVDTTVDLLDVFLKIYKQKRLISSDIDVIVLCQSRCVRKILSEANRFDQEKRGGKTLLKQLSRWLVVSYDHTDRVATTLTLVADDLDNVAVIAFPKIPTPDTDQGLQTSLRGIVYDYFKYNSGSVNKTTVSLLTYATNKLQQVSIPHGKVLSNILANRDKCEGIRIETLMWLNNGRGFSNLGYVTMEGKVVIFSDVFPNTKFGYNKRHFQVSTLHYPPFVNKTVDENNTAVYGGLCMDLLKQLAKTLNFTYTISEPADKKWGAPGPNKTFNGMIGELQREEVDIVAADMSVQSNREEVMDFAYPYYYGDVSVLLKKPDPNLRKWRTLIDPLKWQVLTAVGILLLVVSMLMFLFERFNPFYSHSELSNATSESPRIDTFHDAFWYMYGALLCQGGVHLPESTTGRTFVSHWWLFSIILVGTYCGNLIAFLTVTKVKPPFDTLAEMAKMKSEYKWGTIGGTHWEHVFKTSQIEEFRDVGDLMMQFNESDPVIFSVDADKHMERVREGGYGFIVDTVYTELKMVKDCDLIRIKERFLPMKYAFGFTNNSPHAKIFSKQFLSIVESGLLNVWKRKWFPKKDFCTGSTVTEAKPISIIDVQSAFYVAAGGAFIGLVAFVTELLIGYCKNKRKRTNESHGNISTDDPGQ